MKQFIKQLWALIVLIVNSAILGFVLFLGYELWLVLQTTVVIHCGGLNIQTSTLLNAIFSGCSIIAK